MAHQLTDIDKEIETIFRVLAQTPDGSPNWRLLLACLGKAHNERFNLLQEPNDINRMIEYTTMVLTLTPDDDPGLPNLLGMLGVAHRQRFERIGDMNDLEKGIEYTRLTLAMLPDNHSDLTRQLGNLAGAYRVRFQRLGELQDITQALEYESRAVAMTSNDTPDMAIRLVYLGVSHLQRFQHLGELDDLDKAIDCQSRGLVLAPHGHSELPNMLSNLALSHSQRFKRLGEPRDIEQAIEYKCRALALTPDGHPDLPSRLANLGASHIHRFERLGELSDCEQAIQYQSRALALVPHDHPDLTAHLANLGGVHGHRFERLGELCDLEQAIGYEFRALALTPDDHPDLSSRLANLAVFHIRRSQRLGELGDLDQAIEYQSRALALIPDGHPALPFHLADLGVSHNDRFEHLGDPNDLDQAIKYGARALNMTPNDHPDKLRHSTNLGGSYSSRFKLLGELEDLDRAIQCKSYALAWIPDGHPKLPLLLSSLASSHMSQFEHLGQLSNLEKALEYLLRALALTPDGHPALSDWLVILAGLYSHRFQLLRSLSDLDKAIEWHLVALELTAYDNPSLCTNHCRLAILHCRYYEHTKDSSHLQDALHSFRIASQSPVGVPRDRFRYARNWATLASHHSGLSCIEAYQTTVDLLPQFIWFGATTTRRYEDLRITATFAIDAAYAAIISSNYSLALEWLEHARCVVWNQSLMLRSPLDQLAALHPSLATRLHLVADQLHRAGSESQESRTISTCSMTPEQAGQHHRRLAREYDELLNEARSLPGFEEFLRPVKASRLVSAAHIGPIIAITCRKDRCDALVILPKQTDVMHLLLPDFTEQKAQEVQLMIESSLRRKGLRERGVRIKQESGQQDGFKRALAILWNDLVKPTLDFLGLMDNSPTRNLPHVTWCPTGAASFLPLHAAGDYDQPHSRVFDYVISSYTPTLAALLASTPSTVNSDSRVLAIGQETTPNRKRLPGTKAELGHVKSHVAGRVGYSELMDAEATTLVVLEAMEQHDWVHLACHAHQNVYDPTKSGFFLHDDTLDLAAINQRSFKKKGLAFLSACQTAKGDQELPDEAVHLASGMLMAGYSSVIATMWSVVDQDAPFVADKVYGQLMIDGKLGNGEAGKALHNAVAGLRDEVGEKEFERWVPYIHIGS